MGHVTATYQQHAYRIRSGDDVDLDTNSGWAAAENTGATIDAGTIFRVRMGFAETAGGSGNVSLDLQMRHQPNGGSFGSWADVGVDLGGTTTPIITRPSSQYADGDATTADLLTNLGTQIDGHGNEDSTTASVSPSSECVEIEFCLRIMHSYDGPNFVGDGDVIELRLVESDGTVLGSYTQTPSITVNMSAQFIGGTVIENPGHLFWTDSNGNMYALVENAESKAKGMMMKSANGGDTWTEVDGANRPTTIDWEGVDIKQDGDTLHISHHPGGSVVYHTFNMSDHATNADKWGVTDESVLSGISETDQSSTIIPRGDGTVVCAYRRTITNERLYLKIRSAGGTWGSQIALEQTSSIDWTQVVSVLGANDKAHFFYNDNTNGITYHKSLNSSDTLSAREQVYSGTGTGAGDRMPILPPVYWDDAGDEIIMGVIKRSSDGKLVSVIITNDGTPAASVVATDNAVHADSGGSRQPNASMANDGSTVYLHYAEDVTSDLFRATYESGSWGTDVEEIDATDVDHIRSVVFTHSSGNGGDKVVGYIYDTFSNGGTGGVYYGEYVIPAGATAVTKVVSSTVQVAEGVLRNLGLVRVLGEMEQAVEGVLRAMVMTRTVGMDVALSEGRLGMRGLVRPLGSSLAVSEGTQGTRGLLRVLGEMLQMDESVLRFRGLLRVVNEVVQVDDGWVRVLGLVRVLGEGVAVGETAVGLRALVRQVAEQMALSEDRLWFRGLLRVVDEVVTVDEGSLRFRGLLRVVDESESVVEGAGYLRGLLRMVGESMQIGEGVVRSMGLVRWVNEVVQVDDGWVRVLGLVRVLGEGVAVGETAVGLRALVRQVAEQMALSEDRLWFRGLLRVVDEVVQAGEGQVRVLGFVRVLAENITIDEGAGYLRSLLRTVGEDVQIGEGVLRSMGLVRWVNEVVQVGENRLRMMGMVRVMGEDVDVGETAVSLRGLLRQVAEGVAIGETSDRVLGFVRWVNELVDVGEGQVRILGFVRLVGANMAIGEGVSFLRGLVRGVDEVMSVGEGVGRWRGLVRLVGEGLGVTEVLARVLGLVRLVAEDIDVGETAVGLRGLIRYVDTVLGVSETVSFARGLVRGVDEVIGVAESAQGLLALVEALDEVVVYFKGMLRGMFKGGR